MPQDRVRLGIIGLGAEGACTPPCWPRTRCRACASRPSATSSPRRRRLPTPTVSRSTPTTPRWTSGQVDAVVTTVPHYLHPRDGHIRPRPRGHALVEKPIGVYTKQAWSSSTSRPPSRRHVRPSSTSAPTRSTGTCPAGSGELGALRHTSWIIHVVAAAGLLRPVRVAGDLGRRGRRRAGEPGSAPARPVAVDLWRAEERGREVCVRPGATSPSRTR